jgi:hypothetical protein
MGVFDFLGLGRKQPAPSGPTAQQVAAIVLPQVMQVAEALIAEDVATAVARIEMDVVTEAELANAIRDAEPNAKTVDLVQSIVDQIRNGGGTDIPPASSTQWDGRILSSTGAVAAVVRVDDTTRSVWVVVAPDWTFGTGKDSDDDTVASSPEIDTPATIPELPKRGTAP